MNLEMVLNELSFRLSANNVETARKRMIGFLDTIRGATSHGVKKSMHIDRDVNLYSLELAPGYPVASWLNDGQVDRDTRNFFRTLATKSPYIGDLPEYWHHDAQAKGLGYAFQHDHLAVSTNSETCWHSSSVKLEIRYLELDESDELVSEFVLVNHACFPEHIHENASWIEERTRIPIRSGAEIWSHRDDLFPHLQFCDSVMEQLAAILQGDRRLTPIRKKLSELEQYCHNQWLDGPFDPLAIPGTITPESLATLNKYEQERTFLCPDGRYIVFSWHIKMTPGALRLYIHPLEDKRQLVIGYIGPHLRIVSE